MSDDDQVVQIARLITSSLRHAAWRDVTPRSIALHLVASGVRVDESRSTGLGSSSANS